MVIPGGRSLALLYAANRSFLAWCDAVSLMCIAPFTTGGPVIEVPGSNETSPLIMQVGTQVIAEVAISPKVLAVPSGTAPGASTALALVVKLHGFGLIPDVNATPAKSMAPVVTVAV